MNVVHSGSRELGPIVLLWCISAHPCSSALLLWTDDSQPPFQFLLRLAIAARSEHLGCQSTISCLVPTCEIILRDCATNILLCCNYFNWIKVNHALCCLFASGNRWQSYCMENLARKRRKLSLCNVYMHIWQYVGMLLCGNPGPEEQGCCLCAFGNICFCNMRQEYCVAILVQRFPSFNTLPSSQVAATSTDIFCLFNREERCIY